MELEKYKHKEALIVPWRDNLKKYDFVNDHFGFECDSCGLIPETIYCCWIFDKAKKRQYLRYECFNCTEKIFKTEGYLPNCLEVLRIASYCSFPNIDEINDIFFIAKNFIVRKNYDVIKTKL